MHLVSLSAPIAAVNGLLQLPAWSETSTRRAPAKPPQVAIRFEGVKFAYAGKDHEARSALEDVTLDLPIGKVTAVVGWSGAGKSTLINLLFRFFDPQAGTVSVDGVPLPELDLGWWREQLAIAGQDADLLTGTIRQNIAYGLRDASLDEVIAAAKRAQVHDFIQELPLGYETRVGSRGLLLSGGQRQRIGLARALVRRSPILVLDEATNALDSMTESEILRSLEELRGQATVIVIAHRLSTTRTADRVIALAGGRVVEAGTPAELMRNNGIYAQMVHLQELALQRGELLEAVESVTDGLTP